MIRRMGRPGLVGLAARTAVVAGTATAVHGAMNHHQRKAQDDYEQQQYEAAQQQAAMNAAAQQAVAQQMAYAPPAPAPAPAAPAAAGTEDIVASLQKLSALKDAG